MRRIVRAGVVTAVVGIAALGLSSAAQAQPRSCNALWENEIRTEEIYQNYLWTRGPADYITRGARDNWQAAATASSAAGC